MTRTMNPPAVNANASPLRYRAHPEITDPAQRQGVLSEAARVLAAPARRPGRDDEAVLFKALHAAGYMLATDPQAPVPGAPAESWNSLFQRLADSLVHSNLGLVYEMRKRAGVRDVDSDELNSTGMWSLYQAVLGFDPWRGFRFSTYACNVLVRAYRHLWRRRMQQGSRLQDYHADRARQTELDERPDADRALFQDRLRQVLERNAAELTATERYIIERRFLNDAAERPETLAVVGKAIRLGKERVRQIQVIALAKLAQALQADPVLRQARLV